MIQAATHGKGRDNLRKALSEHLPFKTSGALRGEQVNGIVYAASVKGQLNDAEDRQFFIDAHDIVYVVYSYDTPIAWVKRDGTVHIVDQKFSVTTSKHQGNLYLL